MNYTKYDIECHLLFGISQCYIYLLYLSYFTNICQIGCLDIIEQHQLYMIKNYINSKQV